MLVLSAHASASETGYYTSVFASFGTLYNEIDAWHSDITNETSVAASMVGSSIAYQIGKPHFEKYFFGIEASVLYAPLDEVVSVEDFRQNVSRTWVGAFKLTFGSNISPRYQALIHLGQYVSDYRFKLTYHPTNSWWEEHDLRGFGSGVSMRYKMNSSLALLADYSAVFYANEREVDKTYYSVLSITDQSIILGIVYLFGNN